MELSKEDLLKEGDPKRGGTGSSAQGAATRELPTRTQRTTERKLLEPGTEDSLERAYSEGARTFGGKHNHRQVAGMKGDSTPSSAFVTPLILRVLPLGNVYKIQSYI